MGRTMRRLICLNGPIARTASAPFAVAVVLALFAFGQSGPARADDRRSRLFASVIRRGFDDDVAAYVVDRLLGDE